MNAQPHQQNAGRDLLIEPDTIHGRFRARSAETPDALAIVTRTGELTYGELDRASSAFAEHLRRAGVRPGDRIPVLLTRSADLICVLLAVLKAGAAYAALDVRWPPGRLAGLLRRLDAPLVVASDPALAHGMPVLAPEIMTSEIACGAEPDVDGTMPATVFFTSGTSTGEPKGVVSPHVATTRLFGSDGLAGFSRGAVVVQAAPPAWDAFSLETWGALTTGATLVVSADDYFMPFELTELHERHGVTTLWLTASLFNLFVDTDPGCFAGTTHVYTGGERLSTNHVRRFLASNPDCRLTNGYGPVESCVFATVHPVGPADCVPGVEVPIGRPVPGTRVHVVEDGRSCPPGHIGEIIVEGDGLALRYLDDDPLTRRQLPTMLVDGVPARVYLTGDRGWKDTHGVLHFVGRTDRQVKVRGHRVDMVEVEGVARGVPGIAQCVVVPLRRTDESTGDRGAVEALGCFYVTAPADSEDAADTGWHHRRPDPDAADDPDRAIRAAMERTLPAYAVPFWFVRLTEIPRTANGKADGSALERLAAEHRQHPDGGPRTVPTTVDEDRARRCGRSGPADTTRERDARGKRPPERGWNGDRHVR